MVLIASVTTRRNNRDFRGASGKALRVKSKCDGLKKGFPARAKKQADPDSNGFIGVSSLSSSFSKLGWRVWQVHWLELSRLVLGIGV